MVHPSEMLGEVEQRVAQEVLEVLVDLERVVVRLGMVHTALKVQAVQEARFAQQEAQEVQDHLSRLPPDRAALAHPGGHRVHRPQALHRLAHPPH